MDRINYVVVTDKSIRLLVKNQYTSNVESRSIRTEIKHWVEFFFGVKVIAMNSHRLPEKGRRIMAIHLYKSSTPGIRNGAVDNQRNHYPRYRGGSHKRLFCKIDFRQNKKDIYGRIVTIEYDPKRNAYICLIHNGHGENRYILHPKGAIIGDTIVFGTEVLIKIGNVLPLSARRQNCFKHRQNQKRPLFQREEDRLFTFHLTISSSTSRKPYALEETCTVWEGVLIDRSKKESTVTDMPLGTTIHNIEITLGRGGQLTRAAGAVAKLIAKEGKSVILKLPSREVHLISKNCSAIVGQVGKVRVNQKSLGRAGSKCWLGKRLVVRPSF
ncbi:hypothetical protein CXB51_000109 [Gossypium anomalum]|uniref:Ribosomal protein L2 n=1 Tax=Gossypium anomalum TaxID=47600 RepID=A0A8J6DB86_9ROSI|nr:hypothetical protein CXB51_000109 [Gossypium anomalum]